MAVRFGLVAGICALVALVGCATEEPRAFRGPEADPTPPAVVSAEDLVGRWVVEGPALRTLAREAGATDATSATLDLKPAQVFSLEVWLTHSLETGPEQVQYSLTGSYEFVEGRVRFRHGGTVWDGGEAATRDPKYREVTGEAVKRMEALLTPDGTAEGALVRGGALEWFVPFRRAESDDQSS